MSDSQSFIDPLRLGVTQDDDPDAVLHLDQTWRLPDAPAAQETSLVYAQASVQAGDTIASTASATLFASKYAMPAGALNTVGRVLRVRARGTARNNNANVAVTIELLLGSTVVASNTVDTGNYVANTTVRGWLLDADLIVTTAGATAVIEAAGRLDMQTGNNSNGTWRLTDAAGTVDLTAALDVQLRWTWGASAANNTITMRQLIVELL